jgi:predicted negative regulator of RcsB-dependent stress response
VELGSLPQSGAEQSTIPNAEEEQRKQAKFFFKLTMWALVVVLLILLALGWEYWARTRRQEAAVEEDVGSILVDVE